MEQKFPPYNKMLFSVKSMSNLLTPNVPHKATEFSFQISPLACLLVQIDIKPLPITHEPLDNVEINDL